MAAFQGEAHQTGSVSVHHLAGGEGALSSRVTGVTGVNPPVHLFARENNLAGINDNDVVATVHVGRIARFVLAPGYVGNLRSETSQGLAFCIDQNPLFVGCFFVYRNCSVTQCVHYLYLNMLKYTHIPAFRGVQIYYYFFDIS